MSKLFIIMIMSIVTMNVNAASIKQKAISDVKHFFHLKKPQLILEGRFVDTDPDYGSSCKIHVDFSKTGKEYLSIVGEYTPVGNLGSGIFFNEDQSTFVQVELLNKQLILKQTLTDSFSTGTTTIIKLIKREDTLRFSIDQQSYFLFIPQIVKKTCLIENYYHK